MSNPLSDFSPSEIIEVAGINELLTKASEAQDWESIKILVDGLSITQLRRVTLFAWIAAGIAAKAGSVCVDIEGYTEALQREFG